MDSTVVESVSSPRTSEAVEALMSCWTSAASEAGATQSNNVTTTTTSSSSAKVLLERKASRSRRLRRPRTKKSTRKGIKGVRYSGDGGGKGASTAPPAGGDGKSRMQRPQNAAAADTHNPTTSLTGGASTGVSPTSSTRRRRRRSSTTSPPSPVSVTSSETGDSGREDTVLPYFTHTANTEPAAQSSTKPLDPILRRAQDQWLTNEDLYELLCNFEKHGLHIRSTPIQCPPSGTVVMYNRLATKHFRQDGVPLRKRPDRSNSAKECHMKLKLFDKYVMNAVYASCVPDDNGNCFSRRAYSRIDDPTWPYVLVHYLESTSTRVYSWRRRGGQKRGSAVGRKRGRKSSQGTAATPRTHPTSSSSSSPRSAKRPRRTRQQQPITAGAPPTAAGAEFVSAAPAKEGMAFLALCKARNVSHAAAINNISAAAAVPPRAPPQSVHMAQLPPAPQPLPPQPPMPMAVPAPRMPMPSANNISPTLLVQAPIHPARRTFTPAAPPRVYAMPTVAAPVMPPAPRVAPRAASRVQPCVHTSVVPQTAPSSGGVVVTTQVLGDARFLAALSLPSAQLQVQFGTVSVPAVHVGNGVIQCISPPHVSAIVPMALRAFDAPASYPVTFGFVSPSQALPPQPQLAVAKQ